MFKNYILIAWRSALKDKAYSSLNIIGLTIGIACASLIFLFVVDELTYDRNHANSNNIYRLNASYHLPNNGGVEEWAPSGPVIAEVLVKDFPEVKQAVRIRKVADVVLEKQSTDEKFYETFAVVDSNFFKVFTFPFIAGNPAEPLTDQQTIAISKRMAEKYFNSLDVIGESIRLPQDSVDLKITGVFENYPSNTHLKFDFITSIETYRAYQHTPLNSWWNFSYHTYLEMVPGVDIKAFEDKIKFISRKYIPDQEDNSGYKQQYSIIPFPKIHLHSNLRSELETNSKASYVYIFLVIGIFILIIACINFMNLATARSAKRAKEIGLRKVVGAFRTQLVGQFLSESFTMTLMALILAVIVCAVSLPLMNDVTGKQLEILTNQNFWLILVVICFFVSILAGSYPSFFLSAFRPVETLKGNFKSSGKGNALRKTLVVFQFSISIFLIAGTLIIFKHLSYLRQVDLGFDKEKMIFIPTHGGNSANDFKILKEELKNVSGIKGVSLSSRIPGKEMGNNVVRKGWDEKAEWSDMRFLAIDHDFIGNYNLEMSAGRGFDEDYPSDEEKAFLLNESGMRRLGFKTAKEAIGEKLWWQNRKGEVIGVVKDFHFMATNMAIEPFLIVMNTPYSIQYLSAKISSGNPAETIGQIENVFKRVLPGKIFEYQFLDEDFDKQYKAEAKFMNVFTFFAVVAIIIAALGLYGLALFMTELKVRELGIRKVLGATEQSLVYLLTGNFMWLVLISFVVAVPLSYLIMNKWLEAFPLREQINIWLLAGAGGLAFAIALITVSFQSVKAARANPIKAIQTQ